LSNLPVDKLKLRRFAFFPESFWSDILFTVKWVLGSNPVDADIGRKQRYDKKLIAPYKDRPILGEGRAYSIGQNILGKQDEDLRYTFKAFA